MSALHRYAWRFCLNDSEATVEVWSADYEAACAAMRDEALGLAGRLERWAKDPEGWLCEVPAGAEPPNYWTDEQEARAWSERRIAARHSLERGAIPCPRCAQGNSASANYCEHCGAAIRFWCVACKERLPEKGGSR